MRFSISPNANITRICDLENIPYESIVEDHIGIWDNADPDSPVFVGAFFFTHELTQLNVVVEEPYRNGLWLEIWPDMLQWAHSLRDQFVASTLDEKLSKFMMKLGGTEVIVEIRDQRGNPDTTYWNVTFDKSASEQFLATTDLSIIKSTKI